MINSQDIRKQGHTDQKNQNHVTRLRLYLYIVSRKGFIFGLPTKFEQLRLANIIGFTYR